jgi:hypothetical protein
VWTERARTEHEYVLYVFAENLGEPSLCRQISWEAVERHLDSVFTPWFWRSGSFRRSDCYEAVAEVKGDRDVCWAVRPLVDLDPFSKGYSALSCRRNTRRVRGSSFPDASLPDDELVHTFEELGYDIDELYLEGVIGPPVTAEEVYRNVARKPIAIARAQALVRGPNTLAAEDAAYLADLVAITTGQPEWCERIRAGIILPKWQMPFRDQCLKMVATNNRGSRIIDGCIIREAKDLETCGRQARLGQGAIDPEVPPDPLQTRRLLSELGFGIPLARDWPVRLQADYFRDFLFSLRPSEKDATRYAFVFISGMTERLSLA